MLRHRRGGCEDVALRSLLDQPVRVALQQKAARDFLLCRGTDSTHIALLCAIALLERWSGIADGFALSPGILERDEATHKTPAARLSFEESSRGDVPARVGTKWLR